MTQCWGHTMHVHPQKSHMHGWFQCVVVKSKFDGVGQATKKSPGRMSKMVGGLASIVELKVAMWSINHYIPDLTIMSHRSLYYTCQVLS